MVHIKNLKCIHIFLYFGIKENHFNVQNCNNHKKKKEKNLPLLCTLVPGNVLHEISHSWDTLMSSRATVAFDDKTVASKIN